MFPNVSSMIADPKWVEKRFTRLSHVPIASEEDLFASLNQYAKNLKRLNCHIRIVAGYLMEQHGERNPHCHLIVGCLKSEEHIFDERYKEWKRTKAHRHKKSYDRVFNRGVNLDAYEYVQVKHKSLDDILICPRRLSKCRAKRCEWT